MDRYTSSSFIIFFSDLSWDGVFLIDMESRLMS